MIEYFRDITSIDCHESYQISNLGRIRNKKTNQILKTNITSNGYENITLRRPKTRKSFRLSVHRLVAMEFLDNSLKKKEINHIDSNKLNNIVNNLEWVTRLENMQHAKSMGHYNNHKEKKLLTKLKNLKENGFILIDEAINHLEEMLNDNTKTVPFAG